jgi:hypothetical protein
MIIQNLSTHPNQVLHIHKGKARSTEILEEVQEGNPQEMRSDIETQGELHRSLQLGSFAYDNLHQCGTRKKERPRNPLGNAYIFHKYPQIAYPGQRSRGQHRRREFKTAHSLSKIESNEILVQ